MIYYISATGNDSNNGTTTGTPWQTLSKVNSTTFTAGDQILFKKGDSFYGSLTIAYSGNSGNPIIYDSYGTGDNPIITGFTNITSWTDLGGNIWESTNTISSLTTCNIVSINNINTAKGRYPTSTYLTINSHSGNNQLTCNSLTGTPDYTGGEVVVRDGHFKLSKTNITSQSVGTLNFTGNTFTPTDGYGFFIQNNVNTLTYQNAWYYNSSTNKIRIYSIGSPSNVSISTVENIIVHMASYVTIQNLTIIGANTNGIYAQYGNKNYLTVQNCKIQFCGATAITGAYSTNWSINNNIINDINSKGIFVYSESATITNNTFNNIGVFQGMAQSGGGVMLGIQLIASNCLVQYNILTNIGNNAIQFYGSNNTISNNYINTFNFNLDDGAGIYTYTGTQSKLTGTIINRNIILNGIGAPSGCGGTFPPIAAGIYTDEQSENMEISYNSIYNCSMYGIFNNLNQNINLLHNTIFGCSSSQIRINNEGVLQSYGYLVNNNILVSKSGQYTLYIFSTINNIPLIGTFDYNVYARPIDDNETLDIAQPSEGAVNQYKTLTEWESFSSQDSHSTKSYQTLTTDNDFQFEYNETNSPKNINLTQGMLDIYGTKYLGTISLPAYSSIILMKDYSPVTTLKYIVSGTNRITSNGNVLSIIN
jgi:hypothetical protein